MTNVNAPDFVYQLTDGSDAFGSQVLSDLQSLRSYLNTAQLGSATLSDVDTHLSSNNALFKTGDAKISFRVLLTDEPGWLLCNGRTNLLIATYPALFAVIGATYGGDGITTFGVPDVSGRMFVGQDGMGGAALTSRVTAAVSGVDSTTVGAVGGNQWSQAHAHSYGSYFDLVGTSGGPQVNTMRWGGTGTTGNYGAGFSQNMPPCIVVQVLIKT